MAVIAGMLAPASGWGVGENGGLGPFPVRGMFPLGLPYLDFTPGQPATLQESLTRFSYQYALTNTFINTENSARYKPALGEDPIVANDVATGLTSSDFPSTGYGAYLDVEAERHQFSLHHGWLESVEVGVEMAWISFGGRNLDSFIDDVEAAGNATNEGRDEAERDRFDYYFINDGEFIYNTTRTFNLIPHDPVVSLKWNVGMGGDFLPALGLKFSYKFPFDSAGEEARGMISSGKSDYGIDLMLAKRVGDLIAYFQQGETWLNIPDGRFAASRGYRLFALEFPTGGEGAWILQVVSQSSLFKQSGEITDSYDFRLSRPGELLTGGYKHRFDDFGIDAGVTEDLNKNQNEIDVVFFLEMGWIW